MSARDAGRRGAVAPRRGLFSGMSVPPMDSMPRMRTAFTRGLAATWSSPVLVGAVLGWLLVEWLVVVAAGYPGPFAALAYVSAPVPHGTLSDLILFVGILGTSRGREHDDFGSVTFVAHYRSAATGRTGQQQENSRFRQEAGQWFYVDAA